MIWVGRAISIPLGIVFFVLLLAALVVNQVQGTFLNPDYYPEVLRESDVYGFLLVDLPTSALNEARERPAKEFGEDLTENPLITAGLSTNEIVSSFNKAIPPSWVQELVEQAFEQFGRYITGERDDFEVTFRARDRVATFVTEVKSLLRKADAYTLLYDELVLPRADEAAEQELPLSLRVSNTRLVEAARNIAPPEWV